VNLLPRPAAADEGPGGTFPFDPSLGITADARLRGAAALLQGRLQDASGGLVPFRDDGFVRLTISASASPEGYRLRCDVDGIRIEASEPAGAVFAVQSLLQLLPPDALRRAAVAPPPWPLPVVTIDDAPRFGWRGVMLDVARHFLPVRDVLRFIDLMALHKLNRLHLHLTDDQGWRIEIRRYPRLTSVGGWRAESQVGAASDAPGDRRPHGGHYTQDDIREIVAYAAERAIVVVPEIESPGHVRAAIAAYPELAVDPGSTPVWTRWGIAPDVLNIEESTVRFFLDVLDEVVELFPSPWIGIGGDECPREQWASSARTAVRMRDLGLAGIDDVQPWFMRRLSDHLASRGRRALGWDELLEGPRHPDLVLTAWRGAAGARAAARLGHDVVSSPDDVVYLDYRESERQDEPIPVSIAVTLRDAYAFDPVPDGLDAEAAAHVLGGQASIWTEYMDSPRVIDFHAFPRLCAIAEVLWSGAGGDADEFVSRLRSAHLPRLDALGVEYRPLTGPHPWQRRPGVPGRPQTRAEREAAVGELVARIVPA
jgi:hexosaminidase